MPSPMVINTNIASLNSQMYLSKNTDALQQAMQRLSSGLRVNSASDDASGLAIADGMTSQINGMNVATQNANDAISMVQTADSAMSTLTDTLQQMRDLAVQAANNGTIGSSDRQKLQTEFQQLGAELNRVIQNTQFNGKAILNGSLQNANFQIGADTSPDNQISVNISNVATMNSMSALLGDGNAYSIGSMAGSNKVRSTINAIDTAISKIDISRATLGAVQNRLTMTISNLESAMNNQSAAKSRIMDANFAAETANLSRSQIIQQAGTAMLAQANQLPQSVLQLLK